MKETASSLREWVKFTIVMLVFMAGMVYLTIQGVHNNWFWLTYVAVWWIVEAKVAKNIHLHWSTWLIILAALTVLDIFIIHTFST